MSRLGASSPKHYPMRILAFVFMPNHWHFVFWPEGDGELTAFCRWLTHTHSMRWHAHYHTSGTGHIYQGRFKAFPLEGDDHVYTVCRYVERNPLRAKLVRRAEHWRWWSLWRRVHGDDHPRSLLAPWPIPMPRHWVDYVKDVQTDAELEALRRSVQRGTPFGWEAWRTKTAARLGLEHTLRQPGRPKKLSRPTSRQSKRKRAASPFPCLNSRHRGPRLSFATINQSDGEPTHSQ
jgi:putative transposase